MSKFRAENTALALLTAKLGVEVRDTLNALLGLNLDMRPVSNNWGHPFRKLSHEMLEHSFTVVLSDPTLLTPFRLLVEVTSDYGRVGLLLEAAGLPEGFKLNATNLDMGDHSQRMLKAIRSLDNPCLSHWNEHVGSVRNQETNVARIVETVTKLVGHYDALKPIKAVTF